MAAGEMTVLSSEAVLSVPALWSAVLYFFFQLASVSVMYQHMEPVTRCEADQPGGHRNVRVQFLCHGCCPS